MSLLKTRGGSGSTATQFSYQQELADQSRITRLIAHPEWAAFDVSVDKKWDPDTESFLYFYGVGTAGLHGHSDPSERTSTNCPKAHRAVGGIANAHRL